MSFEVGKQVTNSNTSINRESFEKQEGINKLKKEELNAVWDRFDTNNDGQLDQDEQVGLMAFLKNLAATDEGKDDNKLTRKEVRHARKDEKNVLNSFGENVKLSYKDIKRVSNAFNNLVGNQGAEVQRKDAENYTVGQNAYTINKGTGTVNSKTTKTGTTNYNYDANNDIEKKTVTEGEGNDQKVTTTEYQNFEGVKLKKKEEATVGTGENKTVTTTQYTGVRKNGKPEAIKSQETVVHGDTEKTTDFDPNTGFKKQETIEHKDTKEKTVDKFDNKGGLANRTKTKNGKLVTYTTYTPGGATETLYDETGNNITKEITYSNYNHQNGAVIDRTKTQETIYEKGKKTTTTYKDGKKNISTTTYDNGNIVTTTFKDGKEATTTTKYKDGKTVTHDRGKRQLTVKTKEGKTTTVSTDENGGVATFPKFNGKRMETAGEAADRLGLKGAAKEAFVKKYGGEKAVLKAGTKLEVPNDAASDKDFKIDNVEVNGAEEAQKLKAYKAEQHRKEVQENIKNAPTKAKEAAKSMGLRQTWATGPNLQYQIYSKPTYAKTIETTDANGKKVQKTVSTAKEASKAQGNYQQHYIYNPQNNRMVPLESQIKGLKQGEHVRLITSDGYATVINDKGEERRIKLNFNSSLMATVDDKPVKTSDYNASFKKDYVANKGEIKDADGNTIGKTNLYEKFNDNGKEKTVMTYQNGEYINTYMEHSELSDDDRGRLANADKTQYNADFIGYSIYANEAAQHGDTEAEMNHKMITENINPNNVFAVIQDINNRGNNIFNIISEPDMGDKGRHHARKSTQHILQCMLVSIRKNGGNAEAEGKILNALHILRDDVNGKAYDESLLGHAVFKDNDFDVERDRYISNVVLRELDDNFWDVANQKATLAENPQEKNNEDKEPYTPNATATNLTNVPTHIIKKNGLPDYAQTHSGVLDSFDIDESLAVRLEDAMEKYHLSIPEDLSVYVNTPTFVDGNGNYYRYSEPDGGIIPDGDPQPETKHIQYIKV